MKGIVTGVILAVTCSLSFSQKAYELSHQVMVPAAGLPPTVGGISYQHTVGEAAVDLFVLSPYVLTQGFQQPRFVPPIILPPKEGNGVDFFPNPVTEEKYYLLNIRIYGVLPRSYNIIITSLLGSVMHRYDTELGADHDYIYEVEMDTYASGIYIVRVMSSDGVINRSFKIEKL